MALDHSKAIATISFEGLLVFCVNDYNQCEMAFLSCANHELTLKVTVILPNGFELPIAHPITFDNDLSIEVVNPTSHGVNFYTAGGFDRRNGQGDSEDIQWVIDIEGPEFHKGPLEPAAAPSSSVSAMLKPRLRITDGTFFSLVLPDDKLARERTDTVVGPVFLGKAADVIGADIECLDGGNSGIVISNIGVPESQLKLPKVNGIRYRIEFNNKCTLSPIAPGSSDFSLYYDALADPSGAKFDLRDVVAKDDPRATGGPFTDFPLFAPNDRPQKCSGVRLGVTTSIP